MSPLTCQHPSMPSKSAHRSSCSCFQNRCANQILFLQPKHVESHILRQSGPKGHSFHSVGANKVVMETSHMFPFLHCWMQKHIQNWSASQTLSRLPARLFWFEIKTASLISNQLQLKRLSSKTMSSYMTSSVLFNQMPPKWPLVQRKREFQLWPCHSAWNGLLCTTISVFVTNELC